MTDQSARRRLDNLARERWLKAETGIERAAARELQLLGLNATESEALATLQEMAEVYGWDD